ncbi:hypothetical protein [Aeromonas media]|uniref:hypothetical protein n=1 Tax=Aeromonas media TaxID=651 RepID=UPI003D1F2BB1
MGKKQISDDKKIHENGHVFVDLSDDEVRVCIGLKSILSGCVCLNCGVMRKADGTNKKCPGIVKVGLR